MYNKYISDMTNKKLHYFNILTNKQFWKFKTQRM